MFRKWFSQQKTAPTISFKLDKLFLDTLSDVLVVHHRKFDGRLKWYSKVFYFNTSRIIAMNAN